MDGNLIATILAAISSLFCLVVAILSTARLKKEVEMQKKISFRAYCNLGFNTVCTVQGQVCQNSEDILTVRAKAKNSGDNPCKDEIDNIEIFHNQLDLNCVISKVDRI